MSSTAFREIGSNAGGRSNDRLFKAAISAFCAITRPSRNDLNQLEDLVTPLFEHTSTETRRYSAASLSSAPLAPGQLVYMLCNEKAEICAPLLISNHKFTDAELVSLIGRHGVRHARLIARRRELHPVVRDLLLALGDDEISEFLERSERAKRNTGRSANRSKPATDRAELVRTELRQMMAADDGDRTPIPEQADNDDSRRIAENLRSTCLSGNPALFQTAIADALGLDFQRARSITERASWYDLAVALNAIKIVDSEAFCLVSATFPSSFSGAPDVRDFLTHYNTLDRKTCAETIHAWKTESFNSLMNRKSQPLSAVAENPASGRGGQNKSGNFRKAS